jgi:hypothetical protein
MAGSRIRDFVRRLRIEFFSDPAYWARVMAEAEQLKGRYGAQACDEVRRLIAAGEVDPERRRILREVEAELQRRAEPESRPSAAPPAPK